MYKVITSEDQYNQYMDKFEKLIDIVLSVTESDN